MIHKDDFEGHIHLENDYFIREDNGINWHQLHFDRLPPGHLRSGQRIKVRGQHKEGKFQVESLEEETVLKNKSGNTDISSVSATTEYSDALAIDERKAVVILVDLINAKTGSYITPAQVAGKMYTDARSVDGLYREASRGQLRLLADSDGDGNPDVFGPYTINYDNSTCNYYDWAYAAEAAAQNSGVNLSLYRHRIFILPNYTSLPACGWAGVANVGCGTFCRAWMAGSSGMIYVHELGHNLNLAHAATDPENDSTINSEYGDLSDPMGSSGSSWYLFNAGHTDQMGWYGSVPGAVSTVITGGTFNVAAMGLDPSTVTSTPFILKVAKPNTADLYYLSYRQPVGNYNQLSTNYTKGINIHRYKGSGYAYTTHIKTLINGETFTDSVNGVSFTQISQANGIAAVQIQFGCAASAPSVAMSPVTLAMRSGTDAQFSINVTNKDTSNCASTNFALDYEGGSAGGILSTADLTLAPAQIGSSAVTINTMLADGNYPIKVFVSDNDGNEPHHMNIVQGSATLVIDNIPPNPPANLSGSLNRQGKVVLSWQAATDSLSGIADYPIYRNNELIGYAPNNLFTDANVTSSTSYEYTIQARDKAGNASLMTTPILISTATKGGGGGKK